MSFVTSSDSSSDNEPMNNCMNPSNTVDLSSTAKRNSQTLGAPNNTSDTVAIFPPMTIDITDMEQLFISKNDDNCKIDSIVD